MKAVIDRLEGIFAVCETEAGTMINIERAKIPSCAKEGDVLLIEESGITIDENSTNNMQEKIKKLMDDVWE